MSVYIRLPEDYLAPDLLRLPVDYWAPDLHTHQPATGTVNQSVSCCQWLVLDCCTHLVPAEGLSHGQDCSAHVGAVCIADDDA